MADEDDDDDDDDDICSPIVQYPKPVRMIHTQNTVQCNLLRN